MIQETFRRITSQITIESGKVVETWTTEIANNGQIVSDTKYYNDQPAAIANLESVREQEDEILANIRKTQDEILAELKTVEEGAVDEVEG